MNFHLELQKNRKGIGTIFGMVFFLLIVMVVFASFMIILNQNTSLEQVTIQTRQLDQNKASEQLVITGSVIENDPTSVVVSCVVNNTGTVMVQLVRLWVEDLNTSATGSLLIPSLNGMLTQGSFSIFTASNGTVAIPNSFPLTDQFRFWFVTERGNQFTIEQSGGGNGSQTIINNITGSDQIGSLMFDWANFAYYDFGTSPLVSGSSSLSQATQTRGDTIIYNHNVILAVPLTNVDPNQQDITLTGVSYIYANRQQLGHANVDFIAGIANVSGSSSTYYASFSTQVLRYNVPTTVYFVIPSGSADTNTLEQINIVLFGYYSSQGANYGTSYGQNIPFVPLYFTNNLGTVSIQIRSVPLGSGYVTVDGTPIVTPQTFNWVPGATHNLGSYQLVSGPAGTQYLWNSWTATSFGSSTSNSYAYSVPTYPETLTGSYSTQYQVTFSNSGLSADATGNVVSFSVSGGSYSGATSPIGVAPGSIWVDNGASVTYTFVNPVTSSTTGKSYQLNSVTGPVSPITISSANTLIGNYAGKYQPTVPAPTLSPISPITLGVSSTASVTVTGSFGTPTGTITFQYSTDSGTTWSPLGAVKTLSGGSASSDSYTPNAVGSNYRFRAVYSGDSNYYGATGSAASLTVNQATPNVPAPTLTPSSPITLGTSVTAGVTVTGVSGVTPTGTVTFQVSTDGGASWSPLGAVKTLSGGSASSDSYTPNAVGSNYRFRAVYSGDSNYYGATGSAASLTVNQATPNVPAPTLTPSSPITLGTSVTAGVTVTGVSGVTPTGTVTFQVSTDGGASWSPLGAVKTLSGGSASSDSYTPNAVSANYRIRTMYSGDSNYNSATGSVASLAVKNVPHYIDTANTVHDTNVGTHSSFPAMQTGPNGIFDTLTEANTITTTTTMGTLTDTSTSYTAINLNTLAGQSFTAPANAISISSVAFYGRTSSGTFNVKAIITDGSGHILANGISAAVSCNTTVASRTATFTTAPTITPGSTYWILIISQTTSFRLYYVGTTGGNSISPTANSYASPTDPTGATTGTINYRGFYATVNRANYQLDSEVQFSGVTDFASYTQIQIQTGTFSASVETIAVDYWTGIGWANLGTLTANTLNSFTVSLASTTYELRFTDGTQTNDVVQSSWQIDSVYIW